MEIYVIESNYPTTYPNHNFAQPAQILKITDRPPALRSSSAFTCVQWCLTVVNHHMQTTQQQSKSRPRAQSMLHTVEEATLSATHMHSLIHRNRQRSKTQYGNNKCFCTGSTGQRVVEPLRFGWAVKEAAAVLIAVEFVKLEIEGEVWVEAIWLKKSKRWEMENEGRWWMVVLFCTGEVSEILEDENSLQKC